MISTSCEAVYLTNMEKLSLGFQLKGSTKRQKIVTHEKEAPLQVDLIKSISDGAAISVAPVKPKNLLVIPLIKNSNIPPAKPSPSIEVAAEITDKMDNKPESLELQAEKELIAELTGSSENVDSGLVIQQDNTNMLVRKKAPILASNVDPAVAGMNEDDRFRLDMKSRAEDISFKSEVYERIPIAEYGAALLRGMGWEGSVEEINNKKDDRKIVPREARLGLGATAKPPESKYKGKSGYDDRNSRAKENRDLWNKRIEEKIKDQKLQVDDLVWLRDSKHAGKRGRVVQARGVPGLDQIRVQLESDSNAVVSVSKRDAVLLSEEELASQPYSGAMSAGEEEQREQGQTVFFGLKDRERGDSRDRERDREENRERVRERGDDLKRKRSRSREKDSHRDRDRERRRDDSRDRERRDSKHSYSRASSSSMKHNDEHLSSRSSAAPANSSSSSSGGGSLKVTTTENWLRVGIRVKVISKSVNEGRAYRQKGTVVDVPALGMCSLRLDSGSVLDRVKERQLETVLPEVGGRCMVLVGEWKGQLAVLCEKIIGKHDFEARARVELCEELDQIVVSMDHIAAFV